MIKENKCVFCTIAAQSCETAMKQAVNTILYEDNNIMITPALGMSVPNYLMIFPKQHLNSFGEFDNKVLLQIEGLINKISDNYYEKLGVYPIVFEHGSLPAGRHPLSITHAHWHLIPINLTDDNTKSLFKYLQLEKASNITSLTDLKGKDYWMYRNENKEYFTSHTIINAPRSCFIKIVAKQSGYDMNYEWRDSKNNRIEDVLETINTFKDISKKL